MTNYSTISSLLHVLIVFQLLHLPSVSSTVGRTGSFRNIDSWNWALWRHKPFFIRIRDHELGLYHPKEQNLYIIAETGNSISNIMTMVCQIIRNLLQYNFVAFICILSTDFWAWCCPFERAYLLYLRSWRYHTIQFKIWMLLWSSSIIKTRLIDQIIILIFFTWFT
jgi:hypothetical protein